jgi:hypothetical protein
LENDDSHAEDVQGSLRLVHELIDDLGNDLSARWLPRADRGTAVMSASNNPNPLRSDSYPQTTAGRLGALLASMRPIRGIDFEPDEQLRYYEGRSVIEQLAEGGSAAFRVVMTRSMSFSGV